MGFIHGEGVWSFRLFGNVISSAVLGFGGIFRRTNHHSLYLSSTWNPFSLVKEPSLSLMLLSWPFIGELAYLLAIVASDMF